MGIVLKWCEWGGRVFDGGVCYSSWELSISTVPTASDEKRTWSFSNWKTIPIQLDSNYDRLREKDVEQALLKKARVKQEQKDLEYMKSINNQIYAKMTGKGRQFIAKV